MADEFISRDGSIIVNVDHAEAYIPMELFEEDKESKDIIHAAIATTVGEGFRLIGTFNMRFSNQPGGDIRANKLRTFNYPNIIDTFPIATYTE